MTLWQLIKKEAYVALHAQTWRFRVVKYLVLLALGFGMWSWQGGKATVLLFVFLLIPALGIHFFFRWKTKAWTQSWGPYKKIDLPV